MESYSGINCSHEIPHSRTVDFFWRSSVWNWFQLSLESSRTNQALPELSRWLMKAKQATSHLCSSCVWLTTRVAHDGTIARWVFDLLTSGSRCVRFHISCLKYQNKLFLWEMCHNCARRWKWNESLKGPTVECSLQIEDVVSQRKWTNDLENKIIFGFLA